MSDPGTTYRTREEIQRMRSTQDPIRGLQRYIEEWGLATEEELKKFDKEAKIEVDKAVEEARRQGKSPDTLYALELLEETGICVVPGSGFGQKDGEHHYRLTCLCPGVDEYVSALENFHKKFVAKYGGL